MPSLLPHFSRRAFIRTGAVASVGVVTTCLYTRFVEPHWVEIVKRELPLSNLPRDLQGRILVQLSDLHIGQEVDDAYLRRSFEQVRSLSPDFVVYTGDFISYDSGSFDHFSTMSAHMPLGRLGTFGVLGNHDYGLHWAQPEVADELATLATAAGIRILRNETIEVAGLHICGLDDLWAHRFDPEQTFKALPKETAAVALSHNPDTADLHGWDGFSGWILSGHTHGGQCKPPFLPPPLLPVENKRYTNGVFELSWNRSMYINRGLGHLLGVRFNARPEITVFQLAKS